MEAPADQTMDEAKVEKELGNDYEVGLCQKCDKPCVILGLLVCPCSVYGYTKARQHDNQPLKYGCWDCICSPLEQPTMNGGEVPDCVGCCLLYGFGWAMGPPLASCNLRKYQEELRLRSILQNPSQGLRDVHIPPLVRHLPGLFRDQTPRRRKGEMAGRV